MQRPCDSFCRLWLADADGAYPSPDGSCRDSDYYMISLDTSIIPAILIFLSVIFALNHLLYKPLLRIQEERGNKTTGFLGLAKQNLDRHLELFECYQAAIKNARMEEYRLQEQARSQALAKRVEALAGAKKKAEQMVIESRDTIQESVHSAKLELQKEAEDIARCIASAVLHRAS
jgi:F-type H+-transporting ATPase subunit b